MPLIFLVDDHDDTRELLVEWLRLDGFEAQDFRDAESALEALAHTTPDVVVTDLMLEGMSGQDFVRRVRTTEATAKLPVVACTGRTDRLDAPGFTRILLKPILPEALSAVLREVIAAG